MSASRTPLRLSLAFAAIAILSVGLKLAFVRVDVTMDHRAAASAIAALASKRGMNVTIRPVFGGTLVDASKGQCDLSASAVAPSGEIEQSIGRIAAVERRIAYSYRGTVTPTRPAIGPFLSFQWARMLGRLGISVDWRPLIILWDNQRCDSELTDFSAITAPMRPEVPIGRSSGGGML